MTSGDEIQLEFLNANGVKQSRRCRISFLGSDLMTVTDIETGPDGIEWQTPVRYVDILSMMPVPPPKVPAAAVTFDVGWEEVDFQEFRDQMKERGWKRESVVKGQFWYTRIDYAALAVLIEGVETIDAQALILKCYIRSGPPCILSDRETMKEP